MVYVYQSADILPPGQLACVSLDPVLLSHVSLASTLLSIFSVWVFYLALFCLTIGQTASLLTNERHTYSQPTEGLSHNIYVLSALP